MVKSALLDYISRNNIKFKSPVNTADLVSFKVGGVGNIALYPKSVSQLCDIVNIVKTEKFLILGNGTNCYFTDDYYDGIIIVANGIRNVIVRDNILYAECGASVNSVCKIALGHSLSGLEFLYGIPGTVGGAICMNASAFGGCIADVVLKSTVFDVKTGNILELTLDKHEFGTKTSVFKTKSLCLLGTCFKLKNLKNDDIRVRMAELLERRAVTQPLNMPSAGSTFVKPKDNYASRLIDLAGLKGYTIGGAQVSTKHAGFIVNLGNATSADVKNLIQYIKKTVYESFGIELNEEIIYLE